MKIKNEKSTMALPFDLYMYQAKGSQDIESAVYSDVPMTLDKTILQIFQSTFPSWQTFIISLFLE
jgi:hypothetical protein